MSDDGTRWCGSECENDTALYTLLPINHKQASSRFRDDASVNCRHRNRINPNRDISCVRKPTTTCSDRTHQHSSTLKSSRSYRLINLCLVIVLHVICSVFVTSVNCDELLDSVGARGHFTHTWAVHIPGGDEVAEQVAADHGMDLRGKVSDYQILTQQSHRLILETN